jgi:hypothetical protein
MMFLPLPRNSRWLKHEDWRTFFAHQEQQDKVKAQNETPGERHSRMQRAENAAKARVPGQKGTRVYLWEDVDGFLVRRAAGRTHYNDIWGDYSTKQCRYNSFRNKWDLCEAFDLLANLKMMMMMVWMKTIPCFLIARTVLLKGYILLLLTCSESMMNMIATP